MMNFLAGVVVDGIVLLVIFLVINFIYRVCADHINAIEKIAREMTTLREFLQNKFDPDKK